jgi:hypothetical protein
MKAAFRGRPQFSVSGVDSLLLVLRPSPYSFNETKAIIVSEANRVLVSTNIRVNRMARRPEGNIAKRSGGEASQPR